MKMFHHQIMHLLWCHEKKSLRSMNAHSSAHFLWDCSRWPYLYCMDLHKLYQMCDVKSLLGLKTITEAEKKNGPKMWESMQLVGISDDHKKGLRPLALSRENNYWVGYNKWRMKNANKNNTHVHNKPLIWLWIESKILVEHFFSLHTRAYFRWCGDGFKSMLFSMQQNKNCESLKHTHTQMDLSID